MRHSIVTIFRNTAPVVLFVLALCLAFSCAKKRDLPGAPAGLQARSAELEKIKELKNAMGTASLETAVAHIDNTDYRVRVAALRRIGALTKARRTELEQAKKKAVLAETTVQESPNTDPEPTTEPEEEIAADAGLPEPAPAALDKEIVQHILEVLANDKNRSEVRMQAALTLGETGATEVYEPLISAMLDRDRRVRLWAWKGIKLAGQEALRTLIASLAETTPHFKRSYIDELGNAHSHQNTVAARLSNLDKGHIPDLMWGLEHEDRGVRLNCARALGGMKDQARTVVPRLVELLKQDEDRWVKVYTLRALQSIDVLDDDVEQAIEEAQKHSDKKVVETAKRALAELKKSQAEKEKKKNERKSKDKSKDKKKK